MPAVAEGNLTITAEFVPLHNFSYSLSDDDATITATCTDENCEYHTTGIPLTISAPTNLNWNGNAKTASISTGYPDPAPANLAATPSISYAEVVGSDETPLSSAPTAAGDYKASFTWGTKKASVPFTITSPGPKECGDGLTWDYDDSSKALTISYSGSGTGLMHTYAADDIQKKNNKSEIQTVVIAKGAISISSNAFSGCSNLTSVTIAGTLTNGMNNAFDNCTKLERIYCDSATWDIIKANNSNNLSKTPLESSNFPRFINVLANPAAGGTVTGGGAYANTSIASDPSVTLTATPAEGYMFVYWTDSSGKVTVDGDGKPVDATYTFTPAGNTTLIAHFGTLTGDCGTSLTWTVTDEDHDDTYETLTISGSGDMNNYRIDNPTNFSTAPWAPHTNNIQALVIENGVTSIGDFAFFHFTNLSSLTFGENSQLTTIGSDAFDKCSSLTSLTLPGEVTTIENYAAFNECGFTSVTLGEKVATIGIQAFIKCKSLTSVNIPDSVTNLERVAFDQCEKLTYIDCSKSMWENTITKQIGDVDGVNKNSFSNTPFKLYGGGWYVDVSANPTAGDGTVTGGGAYAKTTPATVKAIPAEGYVFAYWTDANSDVVMGTDNKPVGAEYTFTPTDDVALTAHFHQHDFTYSASGATVTATCSTDGCPLPDSKATVTVTAPAHTIYGDGKAATATLDGLDDFNTATGQSLLATSIQYYKATKDDDTYTINSDALTAVPTEAGDYIAEITLSDVKTSAGDHQSVTASVGYTIAPATISSVKVTGIAAPQATAALDTDAATSTGNVTLSEVTWAPATSPAAYATVYTATVIATAAANYAFADGATATVNGAAADVTKNQGGTLRISYTFDKTAPEPVTITAQAQEVTYSAEGIVIPVSGMFTIPAQAGEATYSVYTVTADTGTGTYDEQTGKLTVTKCGTFTVAVNTAATDTYAAAQSSATLTVRKADNPLTYPTAQTVELTFSESQQTATLTAASDGQGTVSYEIYSQKNNTGDVTFFTLNGTTLTIAAATPADTYQLVVQATAAGNDNYKSATKSSMVTVTVGQADPGTITVSMSGYAFGGAVPTPGVSANPGSAAVTYYYSTANSTSGGTEWKNIDGKTLSAATYYMYAVIAGSNNYSGCTTAAQSFTVSQAAAQTIADVEDTLLYTATSVSKSVAGLMPTDAGDLTYTAGAASKTGSVAVSNFTVGTGGGVSATLSGGAAGDTVTLPVTISSTNYADSTVNVVITLTAKDDAGVSISVPAGTKTYGDGDFTLTASVTDAGSGTGSWTWTTTDDTVLQITPNGASATVKILKAGSATVTVKYESDTTVDSETTDTITVDAKTLTIEAINQSIYVGSAVPDLSSPVQDTHYTVSGLVGTDTLTTAPTLSYQQDGSAAAPDNTAPGTYDIVPSGAAAGSNYSISYANGTLTVTAQNVQTIAADDVTATYGDTDKRVSASVTAPATGGGAISYAVKDGSGDYITVDDTTGALTIKKVPADGKAYVIVTAAATVTYAQATKEVTVTISKADITPAVTLAGWYAGSAANTPSVTGNPGNGDVTYQYKVKDAADDSYSAEVPTASGSYTVKATVAATENYNGASATADFTISDRPYDPAPDPTPYTPSTPTETATLPVSGENETVNVKVEIKDGTATIRDADIDKVLESEDVGTVTIDMTGLKENINEVVIPGAMVDKIADAAADENNSVDGLEIKLPSGSVSFDADAITAISEQTNGKDLTLHLDDVEVTELSETQQDAVKDLQVEVVLDAQLTADGQPISDFKDGNATVTIPYTLKDDQVPAGLAVWAVDEDGTRTQVPATYDGENIVFSVPYFSNYVIAYDAEQAGECPKDSTCPLRAFSDLDPTAWYHDGVHWALDNKIMQGYGDGTFGPNDNTSRAMIVTILYRLEGEPEVTGENPFDDVADGQWYTDAVIWAAENKLVEGYGDGSFKPTADITREQLATILYRYAWSKGQGFTGAWYFLLDYPDAAEISEWADEAMHWCVMKGIINGKDGKLVPGGAASRAETATMLMRYCTKIAKA